MIYLDNAATTKVAPEVLESMMPWLTDGYGNPSSQYSIGIEAKNAIETAREIIARSINADPKEIYFTSGGTESDNMVLNTNRCSTIVSSTIEHHAVLNCVLKHGCYFVSVDKNGTVDLHELEDTLEQLKKERPSGYKLTEEKQLVSIMYANNEIGTIQDVDSIGWLCKRNSFDFHVDAVQAVGHVPIDVQKSRIDYLSASAHKFNGPKGVGFLYIKEDKFQEGQRKFMEGGGQERKVRPGTQNVAGIVGMAKALEIAVANMRDDTRRISECRNILYGEITNKIPRAHINGTADWRKRLPGNLNFRFDGIRGEELLEWLNQNEICVSSGSACSINDVKPSFVLRAIGLNDDEARSSIRFSIGKYNNKKEMYEVAKMVEYFVNVIHAEQMEVKNGGKRKGTRLGIKSK